MPTITEQEKRDRAHRLNYEKQLRMPAHAKPRRSPYKNQPEIDRNLLTPARACMENPEHFPNDFRYLYRYNGKEPRFIWLNSAALRSPAKDYTSVVSAICDLRDQGWEDATW